MSVAALGRTALRIWQAVRRCCATGSDERGQSLTEYGVIAMVIGIALIVLVTVIGHQTTNMYTDISNGFNGP